MLTPCGRWAGAPSFIPGFGAHRTPVIPVHRDPAHRFGRRPDCAFEGVRITVLPVVVWIALVVWLGLVIWSLSVVRAAADADAPAPVSAASRRAGAARLPYAGRRRAMAIGQGVLLVVAAATTVYVSTEEQWHPVALVGL